MHLNKSNQNTMNNSFFCCTNYAETKVEYAQHENPHFFFRIVQD